MRTLTAGLLALALAGHAAVAGPIEVEEAWSRPTLPNRPAAAYALIRNGGEKADRLVAARSPLFERAELHEVTRDGDMIGMAPLDALEIAPGAEVALAPGAMHLMLFGAAEMLEEGESFPLTLEFERAGPLQVTVRVESLTHGTGHGGHGARHGSGHAGHGSGD